MRRFTGFIMALALLLPALLQPAAAAAQNATYFQGGLRADSMSADIIVPFTVVGTVSDGNALEFEAPWDLTIEEVSTRALGVTNPADGDVTVDIQDDAVSALSAPLSYAAASTTYEQSNMTVEVAAGSVVRIEWALTGTSPALSGVLVTIVGRRQLE